MKVYETYVDGSMDIEARDIKAGDTLRMIISRDIHVDEIKVDEDKQEVIIVGRFIDGDGDVTDELVRDVSWPDLLYTVQR